MFCKWQLCVVPSRTHINGRNNFITFYLFTTYLITMLNTASSIMNYCCDVISNKKINILYHSMVFSNINQYIQRLYHINTEHVASIAPSIYIYIYIYNCFTVYLQLHCIHWLCVLEGRSSSPLPYLLITQPKCQRPRCLELKNCQVSIISLQHQTFLYHQTCTSSLSVEWALFCLALVVGRYVTVSLRTMRNWMSK